MTKSQKLNYVRQHQQELRVDKYMNLNACMILKHMATRKERELYCRAPLLVVVGIWNNYILMV